MNTVLARNIQIFGHAVAPTYLRKWLLACVLFFVCSGVQAAFNAEGYGVEAEASMSSIYYGNQDLSIERQPWLLMNDARGGAVIESAASISAGLQKHLLVQSGASQVSVTPDTRETRSHGTNVHFSFSGTEKSGISLTVDNLESVVGVGLYCEQDLGYRGVTLNNPRLNIMGRNIPIANSPAANSVIDGASYGMPGMMVYLNEQVGNGEQGFTVTALRISVDYRDNFMSVAGEFSFAVSQGQLECNRSDLSLDGLANPSPATVGVEMNYIFNINNLGPDTMSSVELSDPLPVSVSYQSSTATHGGLCSLVATTVSCTWGSLAPGDNPQVIVRVVPTVAEQLLNTATLTSVDVDLNVLNNVTVVSTTVNPAPTAMADLSMLMLMPGTVVTEDTIVASGSIANDGPDTAFTVRAYMHLPMEVMSVQTSEGNSCAMQDLQVYMCEWAAVNDGESADFDMVLMFHEPGMIDVSVNASSTTEDPIPENNQVLETVTVDQNTALPELSVNVTSDVSSAAPDESVNWTITADNSGGGAASNVVIYDEMSEDLQLNGVTPSGDGLCEVDYPSIRCTWVSVPAMSSVNVQLDTQILTDPISTELTNDAWVYADDVCPEGTGECDYDFTIVLVDF